MGWGEALTAIFSTVKKVLDRTWGDQTSAEASLQKRAEEARAEKHRALADLQEANNRGDKVAIADALDRTNRWSAELKRLRDEASATGSD